MCKQNDNCGEMEYCKKSVSEHIKSEYQNEDICLIRMQGNNVYMFHSMSLSHVDPLLGNDLEISTYAIAVAE